MRLLRCLSALCALFAGQLVAASSSYAVSDYDDVVQSSGNFNITNTYGYPAPNCSDHMSLDLGTSWASIIRDPASYLVFPDQATSSIDFFDSVVDSGTGWGAIQWTATANSQSMSNGMPMKVGDNALVIYASDDPDLDFTTVGGQAQLVAHATNRVWIIYWTVWGGDCKLGVVNNTPAINSDSYVQVGDSNFKPIFLNGDINYPSGYEGEIPLSTYTPPPPKYVAMGDSFSSGEGVPPFEAGTDTGSNKCHRSSAAYPRLLEKDWNLDLGPADFVACSGATTGNVLNGQWNEPAQIDALSEDTEVATIMIGGNNVGFKAFATACTIGSCDFATTAYSDIHGKIVNDLPGELADVYEAIDDATSSTADIYVVGYPQIAPAEMPTGPNSACYPFNGGTDNPDPELNDGATAYAVVTELNSTIHDAVTNMNSAKFHFVDPNLSGSPFIGHDWCQQDRYFVQIGIPIPPSNTEYSFHPNADGQGAYKTVVGGAID